MSEIEKLYKNAGVELQYLYTVEYMGNDGVSKLTGCNKEAILSLFPEYNKRNYKVTKANKTDNFTPKKQLELIKWFLQKTDLYLHVGRTDKIISIASGDYAVEKYVDWENSLSLFVNTYWQDLTEEERTEIRSILNG